MEPTQYLSFWICYGFICVCSAATSQNTVRVCRFTNWDVDYRPSRVIEEQTSHYIENIQPTLYYRPQLRAGLMQFDRMKAVSVGQREGVKV